MMRASAATTVALVGLLSAAVRAAPPPVPTPTDMRSSVAPLVDRVKASVVAIHSTKVIRRVVREDPFSQLLRERFGLGDAPVRRDTLRSLGSGFVIDAQGTVLTNNHVVAGADEVEVQLDDDRILPARVLGSDPATDVAVVQIRKPPADLRPVLLGDSDRVRVGDYVLAIGNPLGLGQTVTMGIVSAKNRSLGEKLGDIDPRFQDFIQTDAAINQGNSGGPLFNFAGEVIGINSAILNPAVAMNVGFAIPINLARQVARQIQRTGHVARGSLGVRGEDLTTERARQLGVPSDVRGVVVNAVERNSPADKAGLRANDVIVEVDGRRIERQRGLMQLVSSLGAGYRAKIVVLRGGQRVETAATLAPTGGAGAVLQALGLQVRPLETEESERLGLRRGQGVVVVAVDPRGPTSGELEEEDVIIGVNRQPATLELVKAFEQLLMRGGAGRLVVQRGDRQVIVTLSG